MQNYNWPRQALPFNKKTKEWCKQCIKYADNNSILTSSVIRKTAAHKKLNYDLLSGKLDMSDLAAIYNPDKADYGVSPEPIQHYPVLNDKIMLLLGEERDAHFDYKIVVTNPNAISEIEEAKKQAILESMQKLIEDTSLSEEAYQQKMMELSRYYTYEWQDFREIRANCILNHYKKEQNFPAIFNDGFADVLANNEEIYQCTIEAGEPVLKRLDPTKVTIFGGGNSSKIEDADMITIEDYWSPGKIIDVYYDKLSAKDIKTIEEYFDGLKNDDGNGDKGDPRNYFRFGDYIDNISDGEGGWISFNDGVTSKDLPYDFNGNIRVLQVYWKSLRKIKKVKSYDPQTGEEQYEFHTEKYKCVEELGEEEKTYYINEAWHGTMIGTGDKAIFVDCGPCPVQYNRLSNPSKCHFGIIGTIYNFNSNQPYSMIDMMKPNVYLYDVMKDRLNKTLARNMGKIIKLNLSQIPAGWDIVKWLYYMKTYGIAVVDPMKEGANGKMAGIFNTESTVDTELGDSIQAMIMILEFIKNEMSEMVGITKQRQGNISNRETVGGVERATQQSSYTTRWYFAKHDDTKKRVLECFLEMAKVAMKGNNKKFEYILPDHSKQIINVDGDEFAECDYGLVLDNTYDMQKLQQQVETCAQAALQNQMLTFSTYLKIIENVSLAEKIKMVEQNEQELMKQRQEDQQRQLEVQQQQIQAQTALKQTELDMEDKLNQRDNETKILIENIRQMAANDVDKDGIVNEENNAELAEKIREFNAQLDLDNKRLRMEEQKYKADNETKLAVAKMKPKTTSNNN